MEQRKTFFDGYDIFKMVIWLLQEVLSVNPGAVIEFYIFMCDLEFFLSGGFSFQRGFL